MKNADQPFGQSWVRRSPVCAIVSLLIVSISNMALMATEPPAGGVISKHIRDALLADFRWDGRVARPPAPDASIDIEPGVVVLPDFQAAENKDAVKLKPDDIADKTESVPLVLGSGITEYKGRKFTMSTQRLFFVPIGWKVAW